MQFKVLYLIAAPSPFVASSLGNMLYSISVLGEGPAVVSVDQMSTPSTSEGRREEGSPPAAESRVGSQSVTWIRLNLEINIPSS